MIEPEHFGGSKKSSLEDDFTYGVTVAQSNIKLRLGKGFVILKSHFKLIWIRLGLDFHFRCISKTTKMFCLNFFQYLTSFFLYGDLFALLIDCGTLYFGWTLKFKQYSKIICFCNVNIFFVYFSYARYTSQNWLYLLRL